VPRRNRVTPAGDIIATPERGTFFGNRGVLHDDQGRIRRAWQLKRWLICVLEYKGRRRAVMTPGRYTELFFLDEATALAAGHRPCAECRRERYNAFCAAWLAGNARTIGSQKPTAPIIDDRLHAERLSADGSKRFFLANLDQLPNGVLIKRKERGEEDYLLWGDRLFCWSSRGYLAPQPRPKKEEVWVLTPKSTIAAIRAGYVPEIHPSANVGRGMHR
jgi:hypothetical protein